MQGSTYAYDNLGRLTSTTRSGRTIGYSYDAFSNVLTEAQPQGTVSYSYDLAGRRTRMEWPDGEAATYNWFGGPDLITIGITGSYSQTLATYIYDNLGRVTSSGRSNGSATTYTYDDVSALDTFSTQLLGTSNDQTVSFSRDAGTRIIGRSGTNSVYDWAPGSASPSTYTNNGLNQITSAGGLSLTYDARGNMTAYGTNTYGYDIANRLTSLAVSGTPTASLAYDPAGRLWELSGAATTRFLYDGVDLIAEYNTSGNIVRRYVHGPGSDEPIIWYEGSGIYAPYYLHADERGSVIAVADGSGAALSTAAYDAYGARTASNPTYAGRYGFTGQAWLSDVGLYYYKARMYSPTLGRFLQTDPIGYGDGMNLYAYVGNDPVNTVDPSGTACLLNGKNVSCTDYQSIYGGPCREYFDKCVPCVGACAIEERDVAPEPQSDNPDQTARPPAPQKWQNGCPLVKVPNIKYRDLSGPADWFGHRAAGVLQVGPQRARMAQILGARAFRMADEKYGERKSPARDAFYHFAWNYMMVEEMGVDVARTVGNIHEEIGYGTKREHDMDLYNNAVAIAFARDQEYSKLGVGAAALLAQRRGCLINGN